MTAKKFAARRGISASALHYWSWRLRTEARENEAGRTPAPPFVEIVSSAGVVGHDPRPAEPFEVVLGDCMRIRVPARFDAEALKRLVDALERR